MSTAASILNYAPPPERKRFFGLDLRGVGKNIWALGDQVLISGANFVTGVLTARALHDRPAEFGAFSVVYAVLLWCNIFQSTLITQPHNVLGATRSGRDYRRYTSSTAVSQLMMVIGEALLALPLVVIAYALGWTSAQMLLALIPTIVAWQLMEFVRRVLYTENRYADAFLNDTLSFGGSVLVLLGLYGAHQAGSIRFTGALALYALAVTSGMAAILGAWQIRHSLMRDFRWKDLKENWHFGKWLSGGEMLTWLSSIHMQVWWAAMLIGTVASADLRAAQILFGPTRVITFFLGTVLPIRFARTLHTEGLAGLHRSVKAVYVMLIPVVSIYCLLLALWPKPLLHLVYGPEYAASAATVLKLYSLCAFLTYVQMVVVAALTAKRQTQHVFTGSVVGCVIALVMSPLFIWAFKANGAIISMIVTTLVVTVLYALAYRKDAPKGNTESLADKGGEAA